MYPALGRRCFELPQPPTIHAAARSPSSATGHRQYSGVVLTVIQGSSTFSHKCHGAKHHARCLASFPGVLMPTVSFTGLRRSCWLVRTEGLEPSRISPRDPKSRASASSATSASNGSAGGLPYPVLSNHFPANTFCREATGITSEGPESKTKGGIGPAPPRLLAYRNPMP